MKKGTIIITASPQNTRFEAQYYTREVTNRSLIEYHLWVDKIEGLPDIKAHAKSIKQAKENYQILFRKCLIPLKMDAKIIFKDND